MKHLPRIALYQSPIGAWNTSAKRLAKHEKDWSVMKILVPTARVAGVVLMSAVLLGPVFGHGNVTPQPFDTNGLPPLGKDWKDKNPYSGNKKAIEIGAFGYKQNCARCHGAEMDSGGMAPDLHPYPLGVEGDSYFLTLVKDGKHQNGQEKMPAFYPTVTQEGIWAIRSYIESNHKD